MIERKITTLVRKRLNGFPAVALLGPRQVGKTTLAKTLAAKLPGLACNERPARVGVAGKTTGYQTPIQNAGRNTRSDMECQPDWQKPGLELSHCELVSRFFAACVFDRCE
jgi:ATPase subunit of ABC transporter with duplicated ATPase domains